MSIQSSRRPSVSSPSRILTLVLLLVGLAPRAHAQTSALQITPDGGRTIVNKDIGAGHIAPRRFHCDDVGAPDHEIAARREPTRGSVRIAQRFGHPPLLQARIGIAFLRCPALGGLHAAAVDLVEVLRRHDN